MSIKSLLFLASAGYAGYKIANHSAFKKADESVDMASEDSFPASDPPSTY